VTRFRPIALLLAVALVPAVAAARDWRTWPFSATSPWNHPIGSGARYADVPGLADVPVAINYDDHWTSSIVVARPQDPLATILFSPAVGPTSTWEFIANGGLNCGNARSVELQLAAGASPNLGWEANYYSTLSTPDTSRYVLPPDFHRASSDWRGSFRLPVGACPSPDTDGYLAVFQPDGWVLDVYSAVVLSDHRVVGTVASWIDARGDGTGWWNGRRASMLPSFAGLIRTGELSGGRIPHALAVQMPPALLTEVAMWPAYAFDRNSGYSGTLPMGALLAIPPSVDVRTLGLSPTGLVVARAAQDYGVYAVDRGGGGVTFLAELGNPEIRWTPTGTTSRSSNAT